MKLILTQFALLSALNLFSQPLVVPVKDAFIMPGMGWMVVGNVESGTLRQGTRVEVRGTTKEVYNLEIRKIFADGKEIDVAEKWKEVNILISGDGDDQVKRGMIMGEPGHFKTLSEVKANITMSDRTGASPVKVNDQISVQVLRFTEYLEWATLQAENKLLNPGDEAEVTIKFSKPAAIAKDEKFEVRYNGKIIASGKFK